MGIWIQRYLEAVLVLAADQQAELLGAVGRVVAQHQLLLPVGEQKVTKTMSTSTIKPLDSWSSHSPPSPEVSAAERREQRREYESFWRSFARPRSESEGQIPGGRGLYLYIYKSSRVLGGGGGGDPCMLWLLLSGEYKNK